MINIPDGVGGWLYCIIIILIKCPDGQWGCPQHHNHRWGWQRVIWLCLYHHHVMHVWRLFNYSITEKPQLFFFQAIVMLLLHCTTLLLLHCGQEGNGRNLHPQRCWWWDSIDAHFYANHMGETIFFTVVYPSEQEVVNCSGVCVTAGRCQCTKCL